MAKQVPLRVKKEDTGEDTNTSQTYGFIYNGAVNKRPRWTIDCCSTCNCQRSKIIQCFVRRLVPTVSSWTCRLAKTKWVSLKARRLPSVKLGNVYAFIWESWTWQLAFWPTLCFLSLSNQWLSDAEWNKFWQNSMFITQNCSTVQYGCLAWVCEVKASPRPTLPFYTISVGTELMPDYP